MWHLNFIIPFSMALVGLVLLTLLLVSLLCDAIIDGTTSKSSQKPGADVVRENDAAGTSTASEGSTKTLRELCAVEQKALQCAREQVQ